MRRSLLAVLVLVVALASVGCGSGGVSAGESASSSGSEQYEIPGTWHLEEGRDYRIDNVEEEQWGEYAVHWYHVSATHGGEIDSIGQDLLDDHPDQEAVGVTVSDGSGQEVATSMYGQTEEIMAGLGSKETVDAKLMEIANETCAEYTPQDYEDMGLTPKEMGCNPDGTAIPEAW